MTASPVDTTTDLHAVIAALRAERDAGLAREAVLAEELAARDAAFAQRNSEFGERIDHQAATLDVLKAMSASQGDAQPAFDLIARRAADLCGSRVLLTEFDGSFEHARAISGYDAETRAGMFELFPKRPDRSTVAGRAILERRVIHIPDVTTDPDLAWLIQQHGGRSVLAIPLLRDEQPIGVIGLTGNPPDGYSDSQIALLQTFAEQAVIAIRSAETYRALQTRMSDLQESLEYQTATSDVLQVISGSEFELEPVFQAVVETATRLCRADQAVIYRYHDGVYRWAAGTSLLADYELIERSVSIPPGTGTLVGRVALEHGPIEILDALADPLYEVKDDARVGGIRTLLGVPLMRDGTSIGVIGLARQRVEAFTERQIELVKIFADQAVIAIENTRLVAEQREALEQQTATAEVLQVINASPGNLAPVFDAMLERALRLCGAAIGGIYRYSGQRFDTIALLGVTPAFREYNDKYPMREVRPGSSPARMIETRGPVQNPDVLTSETYRAGSPYARALAELGGIRAALNVPLLKEGALLGFIAIYREQAGAFSDKQIALLESFAAQAVIAMENARLINEQREALEQQTATAKVLQVINRSRGDPVPVFDAILESAHSLCDIARGSLELYDGVRFHAVAVRGLSAALADTLRQGYPASDNPATRPLIEGGRLSHIRDLAETDYSITRSSVETDAARTLLCVPLRRDETLLGMIASARGEVRPFSEKEIALLENFAAQAVIAMENARLINEQREALEQQTATADVLRVINASPGDLTPVFDAILDKAHSLCGATVGNLAIYKDGAFHAMATHGFPEQVASLMLHPSLPNAYTRELIRGERFFQIEDIRAIEISPHYLILRALLEHTDVRTVLFVPLRKDGALLGFISVNRPEVRPFSEKEIALLENFAAQAVIAMENARLLTEQQEALEQQTATADVLQVINASPGNLAPVFDAILEKAHRLCDATLGSITTYDGEYFRAEATRGYPEQYAAWVRGGFQAGPQSAQLALIDGKRFVHVADLRAAGPWHDEEFQRAFIEATGVRAFLVVPLRKDGNLLGYIAAHRKEARAFTDKEITLLESFAAQAVIAMENARLLTEQREALEQQTATAEVLQVINSSPGELAPVFEAMLEKALRLCGADFGVLWTYDGERIHAAAQRGISPAFAEYLTRAPHPVGPDNAHGRLLRGDEVVHIIDIREDEAYRSGDPMRVTLVTLGGGRSLLAVPLRKDDKFLGDFVIYRIEVRPFSDKQIALLQSFAGQAVIAMENARLLTEQRETLEQQTATAEVLQVVNTSPGNLTPVFDVMLEKATDLCAAAFGILWTFDGEHYHAVAFRNVPPAYSEFLRDPPPATPLTPLGRIAAGEAFAQIADMADETFAAGGPLFHRAVELGGFRTIVGVPLRKDAVLLGAITIYRQEVRPFSDKQIVLLQNFAAQAVVAMENARLLDEIRQRQEELHITFENMGDGVAMFDEDQHLVAWNRKFQDIVAVPDDIVARRQTFSEYVHYLAERGEYGPEADPKEHVRRLIEQAGQSRTYERTRPDGRVIEIRHNPVPDGGFVLIFSDITERKRNETELRAARDAAEEASRTIEAAYRELKAAQANLIQAEKMASLGQLTAGIAHEIKNPLNFVNNFSDLSVDLLNELQDAVAPEKLTVADSLRTEIDDITATLKGNLAKIAEHGRRADSIVKNMLLHSRTGPSEHRTIDVNTTVEEALNLAFHGARAETLGFNITMEKDLDPKAGSIDAFPQEFLRVMLNLISNGFYAARKRANAIEDKSFEPMLHVTTRNLGSQVEIRVRDNGTGIGDEARDKIFEPFFTTKPAGEGTGLGLSLSYDIIVKQHGGQLTVDSRPNEFTEFQIILPRRMAANEGGRA